MADTVSTKTVALVQALADQTRKGKLHWERTVDEGVFQSSFPGYSIKIAKERDDDEGVPESYVSYHYVIRVHNQEGSVVEEIYVHQLVKRGWKEAHEKVAQLYETARREAMGVEQALDTLLKNLSDDSVPF